MNKIRNTMGAIGRVILVLLGGILFPILIWVALIVAMNQKLRARKARQAPGLPGDRVPVEATHTTEQKAAPGHCWEALHCPSEERDACPAYVRSNVPCWGTAGPDQSRPLTDECVEGILFDLGRVPVRVHPKLSHS